MTLRRVALFAWLVRQHIRSFMAGLRHPRSWLLAYPVAFTLVVTGVAWLGAVIGGSIEPNGFATPLAPAATTCVEQSVLRGRWRPFADGVFSDAPRPWAIVPRRGQAFAFADPRLQAQVEAAIGDMHNERYGDADKALRALAAGYGKQIRGSRAPPERVIIDYHLGVAALKSRAPAAAEKVFNSALGLMSHGGVGSGATESVDEAGVRIALLDGLGQAQAMDGHAGSAVKTLDDAVATAIADSGRLAPPGTSQDPVFAFAPAALVDLSLGDLRADDLAAAIRWAAGTNCGAGWHDANAKLADALKTFRDNQGALGTSPQLQADLLLAAALEGDGAYLAAADLPASDVGKDNTPAIRLAKALSPGMAGSKRDASGVEGPAAESPESLDGQDVRILNSWREFADLRRDFAAGNRSALKRDLEQTSADANQTRAWLGEIIDGAAAAAPGSAVRKRIWNDYGAFAPPSVRARAHRLQLVLWWLAAVAFNLIGGALSFMLFETARAYRRLYTSSHQRDRRDAIVSPAPAPSAAGGLGGDP